MNGTIDSEQLLVEKLRQGDETAKKEIYCSLVNHLVTVCSRYIRSDNDIWDILHDSFIKAYTSAGNLQYRGPGTLKAWITKIVVNESLQFLKKESVITFTDEEPAEIADDEPDTHEIPADALLEMVRQLPAGYRAVFNLYVFEEKSHKEIAGILGIKENTSASQLHKAKAMLAEKIKRYNTHANG